MVITTARTDGETAPSSKATISAPPPAPAPARAPAPQRRRNRLARAWSRTPGRLTLIMGGLLVLIALLGTVAVVTAGGKSEATWALVEGHEPTAADVQRLYRALSDADATAARTFLAAGAAPDGLRQRYEDDIAVAGPTVGLAAVDRAGDPRVAREISVIGRQVPVYAGLVEAARVNNRQGLPIGAAYLRQASHLMRTQILPAAERLYRIQTERVADERDDAVQFPYFGLLLLLATLAALGATQVYLWRVFRRRLWSSGCRGARWR